VFSGKARAGTEAEECMLHSAYQKVQTELRVTSDAAYSDISRGKHVRICLVCSHGGHLSEMLQLMDAFQGHETFFITYDSERTRGLERRYLLKNIGTNPFFMAQAFLSTLRILISERPQLIVSTGSEIAIPAFYLAKIIRIRTIFIESWTRVDRPTGTGKLVYPVADVFLVQWERLLSKYGRKARYEGAIL
jgi:beta-1,4-N-acetylglucosaminyltransferase